MGKPCICPGDFLQTVSYCGHLSPIRSRKEKMSEHSARTTVGEEVGRDVGDSEGAKMMQISSLSLEKTIKLYL